MCGIVGGTNLQLDFTGAVATIRHRGPDDQQVVNIGRCILGFARLAIQDLRSVAAQPMASPDGLVWIVFNGEIYGFRELRRILETKGHRFRTDSDTEVLLHSYLEWQESFVDHIDGMFAIAIYDRRDNRLMLFRDRAGIKPLYYYWDGNDFAFASELKALLHLYGESNLDVDQTAAYDFLTYLYVPAPKTYYRNVFKLRPGHCITLDALGRVLSPSRPFWRLFVPSQDDSSWTIQSAAERLQELVDHSVALQLVADVPVGCFLSGGIDSSVVTSTAAKHAGGLKTFSIGFDGVRDSETRYAREIARQFKTDHYEEVVSAGRVQELFSRLRTWYDEPFGDTSAYPTYCVSQLARKFVTVALSGDGGDELFGGYQRYERFARYFPFGLRRLGLERRVDECKKWFPPRSVSRRFLNLLSLGVYNEFSLYTRMCGTMTAGEKADYASQLEIPADYDDYWYFREFWRQDVPILTRLQYLDFHTYLPDDILTKVDRVSMANSLEVRVPLLSRDLIEFAFTIPESIRYRGGRLKSLIKHAYRDTLPANAMHRRKQGFGIPRQYIVSDHIPMTQHLLSELFSTSPTS